MPAGRPTKYDPKFCDIAIEVMGQGFSKTALAGHLGVSRDTVLEWAKEHPKFSGAVKVGSAGRVMKLETDLLAADSGPKVTSRIFALKNADPEEWSDKPGEHGESGVVNVHIHKLGS